MNALTFYSTDKKDAVSLILITKKMFVEEVKNFSEEEKMRFNTDGFTACYGEMVTFYEKGMLTKVYVGHGEGDDAIALGSVVLRLPALTYQVETLSDYAMLVWGLGQYRYDAFKKNEMKPRVLVVSQKDYDEVTVEAQSVFIARDMINAPTNIMDPSAITKALQALTDIAPATFTEWVGDELLKANFPAVHAVGRASINPPRLAMLTYGNPKDMKVTLVGKGVCFDSGGLDIKPASMMRYMKKDMGGAAHVIGLAHWIMANRLPIYLNVIIPAVENAIGGDAYRPGDILTMRNGTTVEIDNTDAEGRLILADALTFAMEGKPDLLIDFSTLTGAARSAVGTEIAAFFTNKDDILFDVVKHSRQQFDPMWPLPLYEGYNSMLESCIADMTNSCPSPYAGAIVAALFLARYVAKDCPWIHVDMMAWNVCAKPGKPEGGEAMGIRAVGRYIESLLNK